MEPLDDKELNELLRRWEAPITPPTLRNRIPQRPSSRWRWFLTGTIRIPVPVGLAAVGLLLVWILADRPAPVPVTAPASSGSLAGFQPVRQLEPKIVGKNDEGRNNENQQFK